MIINDFFTNPKRSVRDVAEDANELPAGSLGSMPATDYVKNMYSTAAERGMAAPDPAAVKNQMVRNPKGDVDISGTFNKGMKALQNPELGKVVGQLKNFVDRAETDYINHPVATGTGNETPRMYTTPLTQKPNYLDSRPATGTGKENPRLDTRPATARPNANYDNMMQPMETADDYPTPADVAAGMSNDTDDYPDIMAPFNKPDRFGKTRPFDQDIGPLNSEEEEAVRNHMNRWQTKMKNLPDPFAGPTIYRRADGTEFSAPSTGNSRDAAPAGLPPPSVILPAGQINGAYSKQFGSGTAAPDSVDPRNIAPNGWKYVEKDADQPAAPGGKTEPVRMSMTMGPGGGEINNVRNPNIDDATVARARAWAAKMNPTASNAPASSNIAAGQTKPPAKRTSTASNRGKTVKETDVGNTMDDGFKWGSATMPMQDGSVHKYNPQTNSYSQASPPTRPNLNTNISTIARDRTTDKNGQVNQNYSDVSIATNPATGTGDYMHRQDVNGTPTTTFRQNVPAAELAKLRSQHFNEDINRMQNLAGIRKK